MARERGVPLEVLRGSVIQAPLYAEDVLLLGPHADRAVSAPHVGLDPVLLARDADASTPSLKTRTTSATAVPTPSTRWRSASSRSVNGARLVARGLDVDRFAPRIAILVNCRVDFFEEIAKIRATRRLFARMMREEFGARDPRSMVGQHHAHTAGSCAHRRAASLQRRARDQQALALALAGVQAIEISAFDEAYRTPSPESHLVGLRTQQILELETGVTRWRILSAAPTT